MRTFIRLCLEQATESGHTSIAFPAIGSGNLEYPVELVAAEMYSSIEKFEQESRESTIRDVHFVVYHANKRAEKVSFLEYIFFMTTILIMFICIIFVSVYISKENDLSNII